MATLYTAKFNINEKIYRVSEGKENINELLKKVYNNINQNEKVFDVVDEDITYKFVNLHRDDNKMIINGTIVKYYDGINSTYNEKEDKVVDEAASNKAEYVSFSFDVNREIIGFVPKQGFSKELFLKCFKALVEKCVPEIGAIVLILIIDAAALEEKFKRMTLLKELNVNIIPENGDEKEIADLIDIVREDLKQSNAQNIGINLKGTVREPLVKKSKLVTNLKNVAKRAYASLKAVGKDENNSDFTIDSEKDTLMKRTIRNDNRNSLTEIADLTQDMARLYTIQKAQEVIDVDKGDDQS